MYEQFKSFYKRDAMAIRDESDLNSFLEFVQKHNQFLVKPIASGRGKGVKKVHISSVDTRVFFYAELSKGPFMVEEIIEQGKEMSCLHPQSVNTIRIPTIVCGNDVYIITPLIKAGIGDMIMDNSGSGGLFANIDSSTGRVYTNGFTESGDMFKTHPDTNILIQGFMVPEWDKAVALAKKLATVIEGNRYCGWDLAYSTKGWVMVEGNACGQLMHQQIADKIGLKDIFFRLIEETEGTRGQGATEPDRDV